MPSFIPIFHTEFQWGTSNEIYNNAITYKHFIIYGGYQTLYAYNINTEVITTYTHTSNIFKNIFIANDYIFCCLGQDTASSPLHVFSIDETTGVITYIRQMTSSASYYRPYDVIYSIQEQCYVMLAHYPGSDSIRYLYKFTDPTSGNITRIGSISISSSSYKSCDNLKELSDGKIIIYSKSMKSLNGSYNSIPFFFYYLENASATTLKQCPTASSAYYSSTLGVLEDTDGKFYILKGIINNTDSYNGYGYAYALYVANNTETTTLTSQDNFSLVPSYLFQNSLNLSNVNSSSSYNYYTGENYIPGYLGLGSKINGFFKKNNKYYIFGEYGYFESSNINTLLNISNLHYYGQLTSNYKFFSPNFIESIFNLSNYYGMSYGPFYGSSSGIIDGIITDDNQLGLVFFKAAQSSSNNYISIGPSTIDQNKGHLFISFINEDNNGNIIPKLPSQDENGFYTYIKT